MPRRFGLIALLRDLASGEYRCFWPIINILTRKPSREQEILEFNRIYFMMVFAVLATLMNIYLLFLWFVVFVLFGNFID